VVVRDTEERLKVLRGSERDLREAGNIATIEYLGSDEASIEVVLPPKD